VKAWLESSGFSNVEASRSRMWVEFKGTAGQVESAFHTAIHNYSLNGEAHFANATEPLLPVALEGMVQGIKGLHNFTPKPHSRMKPRFTSSISGDTFVTPADWGTIYDVKPLYGLGLDGSPIANPSGNYCGGQPCSIAIVGQSDVNGSDLANFRAAAGLPAKTVTTIIPPGDTDPGLQFASNDEQESDLDLEWAGAIAKNANILFVTAAYDTKTGSGGVQDAWTWAVDNNVAPILSTSYGLCEPQTGATEIATEETLFAQAVAQGMTVISAAGDAGAADCDSGYPATLGLAVDYPASSQYVTGVGGTEFTVYNVTGAYWSTTNDASGGSALQYIPEIVWNDTSNPNPPVNGNGLAAGGGGVSAYITKPSWQSGVTPNDGHRDVPDIALAASIDVDQLLICTPVASTTAGVPSTTVSACSNGFRNSDQTLNTIGGTSAGAPSFAGILALLVQQTGGRLGNINPNLYAVAQISQTAFHDITTGANTVPCQAGTLNCTTGTMGYSAEVGYDQASGWGSIDAFNLFEQWSEDIQISSSPTLLTIQPGASGTATITVAPYKNFTGTVSFACTVSSGLVGVTCSVPSTTVTTSGSTTVTITASSTAGSPLLRRLPKVPPMSPVLLLLALGSAVMVFSIRKQQRFVQAWGAAAALVLVLGAVSCGGGSSSGSTGTTGGGGTTTPTAESGTVTVTATSGKIVNSVSIAVTIP
jgi:subtilase family serine protease